MLMHKCLNFTEHTNLHAYTPLTHNDDHPKTLLKTKHNYTIKFQVSIHNIGNIISKYISSIDSYTRSNPNLDLPNSLLLPLFTHLILRTPTHSILLQAFLKSKNIAIFSCNIITRFSCKNIEIRLTLTIFSHMVSNMTRVTCDPSSILICLNYHAHGIVYIGCPMKMCDVICGCKVHVLL